MDKYRFDDAYKTVYKYSARRGGYVYLCHYHVASLVSKMCESTKIRKLEAYLAKEKASWKSLTL